MNDKKIIIYQILPRLFGNTKSQNLPAGSLEKNGSGKLSAFTSEVLQEIKSMGFTHIWYTGIIEHATQTDYSQFGIRSDHSEIVKGKAGSPYAIKDYYDIDPDLADDVPNRMKEFEELVNRTHEAGLKIILDFVPNHVSREYHSDAKPKTVADLGENDNTHTSYNKNNNFYYIPGQTFCPEFLEGDPGNTYHEFPAKVTGNNCFSANPSVNDWYETAKLNYGIDYLNSNHCDFDPVPDTWHKMRDILLFWASKNIDGFRCDMAEMVPVEFWSWAISSVKKQYPDSLFIAEIYNPDQYRNYLKAGKFDYLYNKIGLYDSLRAITNGHLPANDITRCWQSVNDIQPQMLNFLENHDEQRIASEFFAGDPWKAVPAMVVSATLNTNPVMIYAGQELGEKGMDTEGFSGLDGRTTIFDYWSVESLRNWYNNGKINTKLLSSEQKKIRAFYIRLLTLCNESEAISSGRFFDLMYVNQTTGFFDPGKQFAFMRQKGNELLLIIANFAASDVESQVFIPTHVFEYFGINPDSVKTAVDLLTKEKLSSDIKPDAYYSVNVKKHSARIIRFQKMDG